MGQINLLDCTLRDGGYCNQWKFGKNNIKKIIMGLEEAGIEIIECGYLDESTIYDEDCTRYQNLEQGENFLVKGKSQYVNMVNYGELELQNIPPYENTIIDGLRVAFHKKDMDLAIEFCENIKKKGYKVFMQPMVVLDYTDEEFLYLVRKVNELQPYAFYIVDSFGVMKKKELIRIFYMIEHNLDETIWIGFHSHNNMQLSFSNAQILLELQGNRNIIVDSSIFGMGRGAGNLNTELFGQYLNDNYGKYYNINPLLVLYDEVLLKFYNQKGWGYSLANYLSAKYNCHPNYAIYLEEKNTLGIGDLDKIFQRLNSEKKNSFDKEYIEKLYLEYMTQYSIQQRNIEDFRKLIEKQEILIIASGQSSKNEKDKIINYIEKNNCLVISINAEYPYRTADYIFVSNIRRYKQIDKALKSKLIITSNILCDESYLTLDYDMLTNNYEEVKDNAGLMLLEFLANQGVKKVNIAGMDGFSHNLEDNYADKEMIVRTSNKVFDKRNIGLNASIAELSQKMRINFVTTCVYIKI